MAGVELDAMKNALKTFTPPAHRCELIRTVNGVEYLNDSKATNLHALESALRALSRPIVLIAGGKEKGLDYGPLSEVLRERTIGTVTFGEIGSKLGGLFSQSVKTETVETLEEAVKVAQGLAPDGATVCSHRALPPLTNFQATSNAEKRFEKS